MARKRKRYEKIKPSAVLAILVIILAIYIASFFLEALRHPIGGEVVTNSHSAGEVTHSSGELGEIEYHFIDVGQGDATLIRTPEGDILIDAGENSAEDELKAYLEDGNIINSVNYPTVNVPRSSAHRLCVLHKNVPSILTQVSAEVSAEGINIDSMANRSRKEYAYTILDIPSLPTADAIAKINAIDGVIRVRGI